MNWLVGFRMLNEVMYNEMHASIRTDLIASAFYIPFYILYLDGFEPINALMIKIEMTLQKVKFLLAR